MRHILRKSGNSRRSAALRRWIATYDVIVIGAGVIGLSVARELLKRQLAVLVVEKESDVGRGASGRNSGVIHPGFSVAPGTLKARLNVEGSRMMRALCEELSVPLHEVGTVVLAADESEEPALATLLETGEANGLEGLRIIERDELHRLEPAVDGRAAVFSPDGAIINPFTLVFRLAEFCAANTCNFLVGTEVVGVERTSRGWTVSTGDGSLTATLLVNAAGVAAPAISRMAGGEEYESFPCRGEYLVLDRAAVGVPRRMVYPVPPTSGGLGVHFTPTTSGNTLIGPSAEYVDEEEDYGTSRSVLPRLVDEARALCPGFDPADVIGSFAGVRAKISRGAYGTTDFVVEESALAPGLINLVGIESPGLSSSPAIARHAAELVLAHFGEREPRRDFTATAIGKPRFADLSTGEKGRLAAGSEEDRTIVCRCEQVTRGEVLRSLRAAFGSRTLSSVKVRCRAGMGRCGGAFCTPRIVDILRSELGVPVKEISLKGPGSELLVGEAKELLR